MSQFHIGDFARSIETGERGKILELTPEYVKVDDHSGFWCTMVKMQMVDGLAQIVAGLSDEEGLSTEIQYFSTEDLTFLK